MRKFSSGGDDVTKKQDWMNTSPLFDIQPMFDLSSNRTISLSSFMRQRVVVIDRRNFKEEEVTLIDLIRKYR